MHVIDSSCMAYAYNDREVSMLYDTCGILDLIQTATQDVNFSFLLSIRVTDMVHIND